MIEIASGESLGYKNGKPAIKLTHQFTANQLRALAVQAIETLGLNDVLSAAGIDLRPEFKTGQFLVTKIGRSGQNVEITGVSNLSASHAISSAMKCAEDSHGTSYRVFHEVASVGPGLQDFPAAKEATKCEYVAVAQGSLKVLQTENDLKNITSWGRSFVTGDPAKRIRIYKEVVVIESELIPGTVLNTVVKELP